MAKKTAQIVVQIRSKEMVKETVNNAMNALLVVEDFNQKIDRKD